MECYFSSQKNTKEAVGLLSAVEGVAVVERLGYKHVEESPPLNDPYWSQAWGPYYLGLHQALDGFQPLWSPVIAIADTGVDKNHPELIGRVLTGISFIDGSQHQDVHGHGTMIAGIAAASTNNNLGIAGICPTCLVLPVKVFNREGWGTVADVVAGWVWAADRSQVINFSGSGPNDTQLEREAIAYVRGRNVLMFAARGNDNSGFLCNADFPACYADIVAVMATNEIEQRYNIPNWWGSSWVKQADDMYIGPSTNQPST